MQMLFITNTTYRHYQIKLIWYQETYLGFTHWHRYTRTLEHFLGLGRLIRKRVDRFLS